MTVAGNYLLKHNFSPTIKSKPNADCGIIVVIPCFNEPALLNTINSLADCDSPNCSTEIILVINSSINSSSDELEQNIISESEINLWKENNQKLNIHIIKEKDIPKKLSGPGYVRKLGMDEAIHRFNSIDKPDGIIVSLDADCTVDKNYFIEIENLFEKNPKAIASNIYFEHPIEGNEFDQEVYDAIAQYELYLRYFVRALKSIEFPYSHHTVGSCFCVRADAYCKQGGMSKKNAGEDFYFLQKLIPLGNFHDINTTTVYPSPRPSLRVTFGTGPAISKLISQDDKTILTYNLQAFAELKTLFDNIDKLYNASENTIAEFTNSLPKAISEFCNRIDFNNIIADTNNNSGTLPNFRKRFFNHFNAFRVIKYLNFAHQAHFKQMPIKELATQLLSDIDYKETPNTITDLLTVYRKLDKSD